MKIYLRKIDEQSINKQISYPKDILKEFFDGREEKDTILCEGKTSKYSEEVALLLSTDPRFDNGIKRVLKAEGNFEVGDIMVMYKLNSKYQVELVKISTSKHQAFNSLFIENDRHLLSNISDEGLDELKTPDYHKFKKLLEWFTNQININNEITAGKKTSGQGYKGGAIREFYKDFRNFGEFSLDCSLTAGFQSTFSKLNYIHKTKTGINIRPYFDKTSKIIKYFYIDLINYGDSISEELMFILEKEYDIDSLELFDKNEPNDFLKRLFDDYLNVLKAMAPTEEVFDRSDLDENRIIGGENIILYGVPGAGKSYKIQEEYCKDNKYMERLVFHPDFTYSDFIGQILPKISEEDKILYEFTPGPFTKLLRKSYLNPTNMYYLIIEEINRGNAPAIFGDIFQLLDRNPDGKSEYVITNSDISKAVYNDENFKVCIPSNMSIIGTMNTSDQNVFTIDTAFQRRWSMRLINNKFGDSPKERALAEAKILDSNVSWKHFVTQINKIITSKNLRMTSSEDKRLGTHFINQKDLMFVIDDSKQNSKFSEKVLKYLWDDAFKFNKEDIFDLSKVSTLEDVIEVFANSTQNDKFKVFKDNVYNSLVTMQYDSNVID